MGRSLRRAFAECVSSEPTNRRNCASQNRLLSIRAAIRSNILLLAVCDVVRRRSATERRKRSAGKENAGGHWSPAPLRSPAPPRRETSKFSPSRTVIASDMLRTIRLSTSSISSRLQTSGLERQDRRSERGVWFPRWSVRANSKKHSCPISSGILCAVLRCSRHCETAAHFRHALRGGGAGKLSGAISCAVRK